MISFAAALRLVLASTAAVAAVAAARVAVAAVVVSFVAVPEWLPPVRAGKSQSAAVRPCLLPTGT